MLFEVLWKVAKQASQVGPILKLTRGKEIERELLLAVYTHVRLKEFELKYHVHVRRTNGSKALYFNLKHGALKSL